MASEGRPVETVITRVDHETDEPDEADESRPDWLTRGATIGRYVVLECLGVGGMGVIYSAWDPELDRKLAIKVVRDRQGKLGSTRGRARLLREGQALARLRHPNVISVHDVGTHDGRVFVAMEFVQGETLHRWLQHSPKPPLSRIIDVFLQVGRGLAAAHRAGLVHRDVKPENMMLGEDGRVLVLDFGIAREGLVGDDDEAPPDPTEAELDPAEADDASEVAIPVAIHDDHTPLAHLTRIGAVMGTPGYMSPEQHRGRRLDARSDQFSFCVAMWEALNGDKPFGEGSREKLLARMRTGQFRRFRNREVPRRVALALRRGLAWRPGDRYESMEVLLEALNPRGPALERRIWSALGLGAATGVVIGALVTGLTLSMREAPVEPTIPCAAGAEELGEHWSEARAAAIAERFDATGLERATSSWARVRARLDDWTRAWIAARDRACVDHFVDRRDSAERHDRRVACLTAQREHLVALLDRLAAELDAASVDAAVDAVTELPDPARCSRDDPRAGLEPGATGPRIAELRRALDALELERTLGEPGDLERSRQLLAAAREARVEELVARALLIHAAALRAGGQLDAAEVLLIEAASVAAEADDPERQGRAMIESAALLGARERFDEARRWLALAAGVIARAPDPRPLTVDRLVIQATIAEAEGELDRALAELHEARALLERHGDPELQLPTIVAALGIVTAKLGRADEAVALQRRALILREQAYGPEHPTIASARLELARALAALGDHEAAVGEYERAAAVAERCGAQDELARIRLELAALDPD